MSHPHFPEVSRPTPSQATSYATETPFDMVGPRGNSLYPIPGVLFPPIIFPPNLTFPSNHSTAPAPYGTHGHAPTYQGQPALQQSTAPALCGTHGPNFTLIYQDLPAQSNTEVLLPNAVGQVLPLDNVNIHTSSYTLPDTRVGNHSAVVPPLEDTIQQEMPAPFSFQFPDPSQTLETPWQAGGQQNISLTEKGLALQGSQGMITLLRNKVRFLLHQSGFSTTHRTMNPQCLVSYLFISVLTSQWGASVLGLFVSKHWRHSAG
jgi:hypothetical protein